MWGKGHFSAFGSSTQLNTSKLYIYIYIYIFFFLSLTVELMGESPGQAFRMSHSFAAVNTVYKYVHITCLKLENWNLKKKYF